MRTASLVILLLCWGGSAPTQQPDTARCTYTACALRLVPRWNALDAVRGQAGTPVASLGFFYVRDVTPAFATDDSARVYARRATRVRVVAAVMTDAGAVLLALGVIRALRDRAMSTTASGFAVPGAVLLGGSIPLQFAADAHLSTAVWWYNRAFAR